MSCRLAGKKTFLWHEKRQSMVNPELLPIFFHRKLLVKTLTISLVIVKFVHQFQISRSKLSLFPMAMAWVWGLLLLLSSLCVQQSSCIIPTGASLSSTPQTTTWASPSGRFAFGFYNRSGGLSVGVWLDGKGKNANKVIWTANRDDPPFTSTATLMLNEKGVVLVTAENREKKFIVNRNNSDAFSASMLDSGNFVIYNKENHTIWESFQHPTDTILGGQSLLPDHELISSLSENDPSTGRFRLSMQKDGNLVLYPLESEDTALTAYWSSHTHGIMPLCLFLNSTGSLQLINTTDSSTYRTIPDTYDEETGYSNSDYEESSSNKTNVYSASLDVDGNFRLYTHVFEPNGGFQTHATFTALKSSCQIKGFCGFNSYCTFNDNRPYCVCLPGIDFIDPNQNTLGCKRNYSEAHCRGGKANVLLYNITSMQGIEWTRGRFYSKEYLLSMDECSQTCLEDCNCEAAKFESGICRKQKLPLMYLQRNTDARYAVLLKVGIISLEDQNHTASTSTDIKPPKILIKRENSVVQILVLSFILVACSCALVATSGVFIYKFRVLRYKRLLDMGNLGLTRELTLTLFSYKELKRATNGFKEELGKGSFGAVYKGTLDRGRKSITVKRLEKLVEEGEKEFLAETRAIGRAHHRNLVRLLGYCAEDSKRLLVYEYMGNGSLAYLIFKSTRRPDWTLRTRVALDVARGILYLHEECETPIIHCDIKPQHILMDDSWRAKISDFGMAKLLRGDHTRTFTVVRGTRGYMAPEWSKNTPISVKADIYSFGIVLLETVFCRRNLDTNVSKLDDIILSSLVYRCLVERELDKLVVDEEVDKGSLERMVMVALWCIQVEPALRPTIKSVVLVPCPTDSFM